MAVGTPCPKETFVSLGIATASRFLAVCGGDVGLGHQQKTAFRTTDAGRTWQAVGAPPQVTGTTLSLTTDGDFVADNQSVSVSRDGDASWHVALASDGGVTRSGFESARLGFAIGGFTGSADLAMRITRDAGRHWSPVAF